MAPTELTEEEKKKGLDLKHPAVRNRLATSGIATAAKGRRPRSLTRAGPVC